MSDSPRPPDSEIPEPTREDLLNLAHVDERQLLESRDIPTKNTDPIWSDLRRRWTEGHRPELTSANSDIQPQQKDFTEAESHARDLQPTDDELIGFMSPKTRSTWESRTNLTPEERARIWQGNKKLYFAAQRAKAEQKANEPTATAAKEFWRSVDMAARGAVLFRKFLESRDRRGVIQKTVDVKTVTEQSTPTGIALKSERTSETLTPPQQNRRNWQTLLRWLKTGAAILRDRNRVWRRISVWSVFGFLAAAAIGVGMEGLGLNPPDYLIARVSFIVAAFLLLAGIVHWLVVSTKSNTERLIAFVLLGGLIVLALVQSLRWVKRREQQAQPVQTERMQTPVHPMPTVAESPRSVLPTPTPAPSLRKARPKGSPGLTEE